MAIWKDAAVEQREAMVLRWLSGHYTAREVADRYEVSRQTLYDWAARYQAEGRLGLLNRRPVARTCPHRTSAAVAAAIVEARDRWGWGPKKLRAVLRRTQPTVAWPAPSTMGDILRCHGRTASRRRRSQPRTPFRQKFPTATAGELMTVDFKGQFKTGEGRYCYPLTVMDRVSRFLLACDALDSTRLTGVWPVFERVFREYGLPVALQSDNGVPFVSPNSLARVSTFTVRLMKLDIQPVLSDPGHPEQNGAHERMHRTLAKTTRPPAATGRDQQARFDAFRAMYNEERPHEALGQTPPAQHFHGSPRPFPARLPSREYAPWVEVRRVSPSGRVKFKGGQWFVGLPFVGERLGFAPIDDGLWSMQFGRFELARLDERTRQLL